MTEIEIRPVRPSEDAAAILAHTAAVLAEPGLWVMTRPDEFRYTTEEEVEHLDALVAHATSAAWVACPAGSVSGGPEIVGFLAARGGARARLRHAVNVGMSVSRAHRRRGVGRRLLQACLSWARAHEEVLRVDLTVIADNAPALHLYRSLGFEVEGVKRGSYRRDGRLHDEYLMATLLQ